MDNTSRIEHAHALGTCVPLSVCRAFLLRGALTRQAEQVAPVRACQSHGATPLAAARSSRRGT